MSRVSDCCGAYPRSINGDCDTEDLGICPECHDYCEYVEEGFEEEEEETGRGEEENSYYYAMEIGALRRDGY